VQGQIVGGTDGATLTSTDPCAKQTVTAGDVDEMQAALSKAYGDVTIRLASSYQRLIMKLTTYNLNNVALGKLQLTKSTVHTARYPWFAVCLPLDGEIRVKTQRGSTRVAGNQGAVVNPGEAVQVDYDAEFNAMQTVVFDRASLEAELALMLGRSPKHPLTFDFGIGAFKNNAFVRTLSLLPNELTHPSGLAHVPALASRLGRLLMASLLSSHQHNFSAELRDPSGVYRPRTVRTAIDAIQHDPVAIQTVADIAKSAGLSVRALAILGR
jgi:hypothetical protein